MADGWETKAPLLHTREFLLNLQAAGDTVVVDHLVFGELVRANESEKTGRRKTERKRGQRGGVRRRLQRNRFQLPLPSMILSNVCSILPTVQILISTKYVQAANF